jgi:nucleotide sugar dehydrogenase
LDLEEVNETKEQNHVIIGAGVVGTATGVWLKANTYHVTFCDIKPEVLEKLKHRGFPVTSDLKQAKAHFYWICTAEWDVENILKQLSTTQKQAIILIRSTTPPGTIEQLAKKYNIPHLAHIPEFLREKTAIADIFDNDRIIIGTTDSYTKEQLQQVFSSATVPVIFTTPTSSELIKYASNCWLAMTISYWNEIKSLCDTLKVNPQQVANAATLDRRISKYGSAMLGAPYAGFCFPKDMDALIKAFEDTGLTPILLKAVREVNETIKKIKKGTT